MKNVTVYLGSSSGNKPCFVEAAYHLGQGLAKKGIGVVYGGAAVGTMKALSDGVLSAGGNITGVFPKGFKGKKEARAEGIEVQNRELTSVVEVRDLSERKKVMEEMGEGCIALPGSFGTFDELFEYVVNRQLGFLPKPIFILNLNGYYDPLVQMIDNMAENGFIHDYDKNLIRFCDSVEDILSCVSDC